MDEQAPFEGEDAAPGMGAFSHLKFVLNKSQVQRRQHQFHYTYMLQYQSCQHNGLCAVHFKRFSRPPSPLTVPLTNAISILLSLRIPGVLRVCSVNVGREDTHQSCPCSLLPATVGFLACAWVYDAFYILIVSLLDLTVQLLQLQNTFPSN